MEDAAYLDDGDTLALARFIQFNAFCSAKGRSSPEFIASNASNSSSVLGAGYGSGCTQPTMNSIGLSKSSASIDDGGGAGMRLACVLIRARRPPS